jgi:hypothetical protein
MMADASFTGTLTGGTVPITTGTGTTWIDDASHINVDPDILETIKRVDRKVEGIGAQLQSIINMQAQRIEMLEDRLEMLEDKEYERNKK